MRITIHNHFTKDDASSSLRALREVGTNNREAFERVFAQLSGLSKAELDTVAIEYASLSQTKLPSKAEALNQIHKAYIRMSRFENRLK